MAKGKLGAALRAICIAVGLSLVGGSNAMAAEGEWYASAVL